MKVLVTGGTGFVGGEILRQLHSAGHSIRLLARSKNSAHTRDVAEKYKVEISVGNILDSASLAEFLSSGDAVIHLVGIISEAGQNTFENIHARGTENVVTAAKKSGVKRFIHMSALGTRPDAVSRYHQSKWIAEETVRRSGLEFTIFRPSIIYGAHDQFTTMFARMAKLSPALPVIGSGEGTLQPVPVENVAEAFVKSLSEPRAIGKTIDLVGPEVLTMNQLLDEIIRAVGRRKMKVHLPLPLARALAAMLELIYPTLFRKAPPLNRDQIVMLQEKTTGDAGMQKEILGINPPKFREGIACYLPA